MKDLSEVLSEEHLQILSCLHLPEELAFSAFKAKTTSGFIRVLALHGMGNLDLPDLVLSITDTDEDDDSEFVESLYDSAEILLKVMLIYFLQNPDEVENLLESSDFVALPMKDSSFLTASNSALVKALLSHEPLAAEFAKPYAHCKPVRVMQVFTTTDLGFLLGQHLRSFSDKTVEDVLDLFLSDTRKDMLEQMPLSEMVSDTDILEEKPGVLH